MSDIDTVRAIYDAIAVGDIDTILGLIDDSYVQTQDERLPWGGCHEGKDGFATFGLTLIASIESRVEIEELFEADDEVIQVGRTRGTVVANGEIFDIPEVHRWTIRDGKAVRAHFAIDTPAMLEVLGR